MKAYILGLNFTAIYTGPLQVGLSWSTMHQNIIQRPRLFCLGSLLPSSKLLKVVDPISPLQIVSLTILSL